jgi:c-di-GMP-binding flagellar brake protein YcgR
MSAVNGETDSQVEITRFIKRENARFSAILPITYWRSSKSPMDFAYSANISEGGLMLYLPEVFETGQLLRLQLFFAPSSIELKVIESNAQVAWKDSEAKNNGYYRTGMKFMEISRIDLDRLRRFLVFFGLK